MRFAFDVANATTAVGDGEHAYVVQDISFGHIAIWFVGCVLSVVGIAVICTLAANYDSERYSGQTTSNRRRRGRSEAVVHRRRRTKYRPAERRQVLSSSDEDENEDQNETEQEVVVSDVTGVEVVVSIVRTGPDSFEFALEPRVRNVVEV